MYKTDSEIRADAIADMYHQLIRRGLLSTSAERIVLQMIDRGYFDKK